MYLNASTDKIEIVLAGNITTNQLQWNVSWQDITSAGMTLPQTGGAGNTNNTTSVDIVAAPAASTTRQVTTINVYNNDSVSATVIIRKDVSGTEYILTKALLAASDTLHYSRESGWTILKQSTQESVILTEFTSNGTWTKPIGLKRAFVSCVGGGGGGGSGRCDNAGTNRFGGGGGGGGAITFRQFAASDLPSSINVIIGNGGIGGTGVSTAATNGNPGTAGGDTSFGGLIITKGGSFGTGGTGASGTGGQGGNALLCSPLAGPYSLTGAGGGSGSSGNGSGGSQGLSATTGAAGGGGGGGISSTNVSATNGGSGGSIYSNGTVISGPSAGASPNGLSNQSNFLFFSTTLASLSGLGTGGAGGYPPNIVSGNGGNYGAGGGGGYASLTGTTSGSGGNGGGGLCIVMEIY